MPVPPLGVGPSGCPLHVSRVTQFSGCSHGCVIGAPAWTRTRRYSRLVIETTSYVCRSCSQRHDGPPFAYGALAPAVWTDELLADARSVLGEEQCVIEGRHFFVRAGIVIPVVDTDADFEWGVWVSLSEQNFQRMSQRWNAPGREEDSPSFGWLSTDISIYEPSTLNLKTNVHWQPVGQRPLVELEPTDHPLAVEQRTGISLARVQQIAELLLHA